MFIVRLDGMRMIRLITTKRLKPVYGCVVLTGEKVISCLKTPDSCLPEKMAPALGNVTERVPFCTSLGEVDSVGGSPRCMPKTKTKKIIYDIEESDDYDREEIPTYEEVVKLYPRPGFLRPLVLIGPPGIGRNELKRRLMITNPEKFRTPTPCKYSVRDV